MTAGPANKLKDSFPDARIRAFAGYASNSGSEPTPFKSRIPRSREG